MNRDNIKTQIMVKEQKIEVLRIDNNEYISLTDLAKYIDNDDPSGLIKQWMSSKDSFDFYGLWEEINNPNFNLVEFHLIKINIADKGNIRDYTDLLHLVILNNLENINAELIKLKIPQNERLIKLNDVARTQMEILKNNKSFSNLKYIDNDNLIEKNK